MAHLLKKVKIDKKNLAFFRFKEFEDKYLITNEIGNFAFLKKDEFKKFLEGKLKKNSKKYQELSKKGFIKDEIDILDHIERYRQINSFLFQGSSLHIFVVTKRCNFNCIYCQVVPEPMKAKNYDMDIKTAKKAIDMVFESPSKAITIEFQGGEPLANWKTVKFIIKYAKEKNKKIGKNMRFALVSNLSLMTNERLKFLLKNNVGICTSLDGPEELQNKNRPWTGGNSYKIITYWIKKIKEYGEKLKKEGKPEPRINALVTLSKFSLKYPRQIIDEYLKWGFKTIHLRPLSYLGLSGDKRKEIGYSLEEFMDFWKKGINYLIEVNLRGNFIIERQVAVMMEKISGKRTNYLDLRSPCGAICGMISYNFDGKIFPCDEARMVGDEFCIGKLGKQNYQQIISHSTLRSLCIASLLENLPCDSCVYKPYCGVCPVQNYALYGDIFTSPPLNERCRMNSQMFDFIFKKIQNEKIKKIFENWTAKRR